MAPINSTLIKTKILLTILGRLGRNEELKKSIWIRIKWITTKRIKNETLNNEIIKELLNKE